MIDHYRLTEEAYNGLLEKGVTVGDMVRERKRFRIPGSDQGDEHEVSHVMLMYYYDQNGDWNSGFESNHKMIAKAVFECLNNSEKVQVMGYMEEEE